MAEQATNVFHGASGFEIQGGQFYSAAGNIVMQSPQMHRVQQAQSGNVASFMPPDTPEERESVTYARLLWSKGRGYPLWSPKPSSNLPEEYTTQGVHIGDVGIISADGAFDFLFNICKSANHPINCNGVPVGFVPLGDPEPSTVVSDIEFVTRAYLMSKSMRGGPSSSRSTSSNNETESLSYSFVCNKAEGALLLLPEGGFRQDMQNLGQFRRYAAQNGGLWYQYANGERLGREASNGSIHLVTGFDKSHSWAVAAFSDSPLTHTNPQIGLELNGQEVRTQAGRSYYWDQLGPARIKYGPVPVDAANQCIFLRSFSISLSTRLWGKIFGVVEVTKTTDMPFRSFSPSNSPIPFQGGSPPFLWGALSGPVIPSSDFSVHAQQPDTAQDEPEVMTSPTSATGESLHPGRFVNSFLLKHKPDAVIAISHDYQWAHLGSRHLLFDNIDEDKVGKHILTDFDVKMEDGKAVLFSCAVFLVNATKNTKPVLNDVNEFPASSCDVSNFESALTHAYCQSLSARARRPKNLVKSITYHTAKELQYEYLVVTIENPRNSFARLKLERAQNQSFEKIPTLFPNYAAIDVIKVLDSHDKVKEVDARTIDFANNDFTLHNLSMIAKVVHEVGEMYPWPVDSPWFVAGVAVMAVRLYGSTPAWESPVEVLGFAGRPWVATIEALADAAIPVFKKLKDTNEQLIREAFDSAIMARDASPEGNG